MYHRAKRRFSNKFVRILSQIGETAGGKIVEIFPQQWLFRHVKTSGRMFASVLLKVIFYNADKCVMNPGKNLNNGQSQISREARNPGNQLKSYAMGDLILIIDDEPDICQLLQLSLSKHGYKVKYVHRLAEGLKFLEHQQPDVLFLDIHLPDGSGLEALPVIKTQYPNLPVITISAYDNGMEKQRALTAGAAHFLPKPFNVGELQEILYDVKS